MPEKIRKREKNRFLYNEKTEHEKLTQMSDINVLPFTIVQKLEETGIPQDSLIFYQNNRWVYQIGYSFS